LCTFVEEQSIGKVFFAYLPAFITIFVPKEYTFLNEEGEGCPSSLYEGLKGSG
jgi:hypothetical protein